MKNIAMVLITSKLGSLFITHVYFDAKVEKKSKKTKDFMRISYLCRKINNDGRQFTHIPMVLPIRHGDILPVPDEEGGTECE